MPSAEGRNGAYAIDLSEAVAERLKKLQRRASRRGLGHSFRRAFRRILARLRRDPTAVGELLYFLPALRLQMRIVVVAPLVIDFAVSEDHAVVYIRDAKVLALPGQ